MTGVQVVESIVSILVSGLTSFATGIGNGVKGFVEALWFTTVTVDGVATQQISVYAIMILSFAAIALTIGLSRLIFNWLQNLGN